MAFHHLAFATNDLAGTHAFYTEVLGFPLVKVEAIPTPSGGWAKHLFYDTGGGELIAFWDLHDDTVGTFDPSISRGLGVPDWVNHVAFAAGSVAALEVRRDDLVAKGQVVVEIDHGWCRSVYVSDPNHITVEFCVSTRAFTAADAEEAATLLADPSPALAEPKPVEVHGLPPKVRA